MNVLVILASYINNILISNEGYKEASNLLDRDYLLFCISLLDYKLYDSKYDSTVISFLIVLDIDTNVTNFKELANFTSLLSALIKVSQMLVI